MKQKETGIAISWSRNHEGIICDYYDISNRYYKWLLFVDYPKREILQKLRQQGISVSKTIERKLYKI